MEFFSFVNSEAVHAAIIITIIGIGIRVGMALADKGIKSFSIQMMAISLVVGFLTSLQLVLLAIENMPHDIQPTTQLSLFTGQVLTVMGVDSGAKYVGKKLEQIRKPT